MFGGALVAGTALAAVTLIPFFEALHSLCRPGRARRPRAVSHQASKYLLGIFLHDFWGRQTRTTLEFPSAMEETAYYVGALTADAGGHGAHRAAGLASDWRSRGWASLALAVATGLQPIFDIVNGAARLQHRPQRPARRGLRLLRRSARRLGTRRSDADARARIPRRAALLPRLRGLLALPLVVMAAGGLARAREAGLGASRGLGLPRHPPAFTPDTLGSLKELIRLASLLEWLVLAAPPWCSSR